MVGLLDLPDELLEVVIYRFIKNININDWCSSISLHLPHFPKTPFGAVQIAPLRLVNRRIQSLVDTILFREVNIRLCSDHVFDNGQNRLERVGKAHYPCGSEKHGLDSSCWHILNDNGRAAGTRKLDISLCFTGQSPLHQSRVQRSELHLNAVLRRFQEHIQDLRISVAFAVDYDDDNHRTFTRAPPLRLSDPDPSFQFAQLRKLRVHDIGLIFYLLDIAKLAPALREVEVDPGTPRGLSSFAKVIPERYGVTHLQLPPTGSWDSLTIHGPSAGWYPCVFPFLRISSDIITLRCWMNEWFPGQDNLEAIVNMGGRVFRTSNCEILSFEGELPGCYDGESSEARQIRRCVSGQIRQLWGDKKKDTLIRWKGMLGDSSLNDVYTAASQAGFNSDEAEALFFEMRTAEGLDYMSDMSF